MLINEWDTMAKKLKKTDDKPSLSPPKPVEETPAEVEEVASPDKPQPVDEPEARDEPWAEAAAVTGTEEPAEEPEAADEALAEAEEGPFAEESAEEEEPVEEPEAADEALAEAEEGPFAEEPADEEEPSEETAAADEALAEAEDISFAMEPLQGADDEALPDIAFAEEPADAQEPDLADEADEASTEALDIALAKEPAAVEDTELADEAAAAEELLAETEEVSFPEEAAGADAAVTAEVEAADEAATEAEGFAAAEGMEEEAALEEGLAEEELPEEEEVVAPEPRPRVAVLTIILLFLNMLAALVFAFLFFLDFSKRQEWSYRIFQHDLVMQGLPLRGEENRHSSTSRELIPRKRLTPEQLAEVYKERTKKGVADFQAVDEAFKAGIRPEHLTPEALGDHFAHFQGAGEPVKTLEDEIDRLKLKLAGDIEEAAKEGMAGAKTEADKRQLLAKLWLPLAPNAKQIEIIDDSIKKAKDADLNGLLLDVAQRRLYLQILGPLDGFRPEAPHQSILEKIAEPEVLKIDAVKKLLDDRLDAALADQYNPDLQFGSDWAQEKRESIERRQYIAFVLCVLGEVKKLDGATPLYPKGAERAQLVVGLYEYTLAVQALTNILLRVESPLLEAIRIDREGYEFEGNKKKNPGFVHLYQAETDKIKDLAAHVKEIEVRLKDRQELCQREQKVFQEREAHLQDITAKVVAARLETDQLLKELRRVQHELFEAQKFLANAFEENLRLEEQIRQADAAFRKGGRP